MKPYKLQVMIYRINLEKVVGCQNYTLEICAKGPQGQDIDWCETFTSLGEALTKFVALSELLHSDEVDC